MAEDINQHIAEWDALINSYIAARDRVLSKAPTMPFADVRLSLYGLTGNSFVTSLLTLKMVKTTLLDNRWWEINVPSLPEHAKRQFYTDQLVEHSKITGFVLLFSFYESVIRVLLRAVLPGACSNGFDAFASVYTCLLTHLGLTQHIPVLDFARTVRNLIHNNGVYIHKSGKNEAFSFRGNTYVFDHGKMVKFAYPNLLMGIYEDLLKLSDDLNAHAKVAGLPPTPMEQP